MDNLISKLKAFSDSDVEATQFIEALNQNQLEQLSKEICARIGFNKQYPDLTISDSHTQEFLNRMDIVVNKRLDDGLAKPEEYAPGCTRKYFNTLLSCKQFEEVNMKPENGWKLAVRVDSDHCYWYNRRNMEMVFYVDGEVNTITAYNPLRFWAMVVEKQLQFDAIAPLQA